MRSDSVDVGLQFAGNFVDSGIFLSGSASCATTMGSFQGLCAMLRVSAGLKIHADSSSNGSSRPASHKSSTLRAHQISRRGKRQEEEPEKRWRLQEHRNWTRSQYRCCRNRNAMVVQGEAFVCEAHRMSVLGECRKGSQIEDSSRA